VSKSEAFSPDYATARQRFRQAASRLGWQLEDHPIGVAGPGGDPLTLDVACSPSSDAGRVLVVSSGVHGVEGFFGSAVQVGLLERWGSRPVGPLKCVFLHGLNPFGFAWIRRFDENNVDPNRNFLLPGERYEGFPAGYAGLDDLLNPQRPPSRWESFTVKALWAIARHGMPALRQTVAAGQYEFPRGLFFGGAGPSRTHQLLGKNLERWLRGSRDVVHLDFHTGLGPKGACKLLIDYPLSQRQRTRLTDWFGAGSFEACDSSNIAYDARGGFGRWCVSRNLAPDYLFACAEFGTFGPIQVLSGLRAENQAHHWGTPTAASTVRAKHRLKELFCPSAEAWRSQVLDHSFDLVARAVQGLAGVPSSPVGPVTAEPNAAPDRGGNSCF
jgi:hypothetical protein